MSVVSLTGSGDGDVRERAGGGQEEPERGAGRECEAVSATGGGGRGRAAVRVSRRAGPGRAWLLRGPFLSSRPSKGRVCEAASALAWPRAPLRWWEKAVGLGTTLFVWCLHFPALP